MDKTSNSEFKYQFLDQIIFLKLNKKNSEMKCQFLDSNNNIQISNVHFKTQLIFFLN